MHYINIHTHHPPQPNEWAIQNLYNNFERVHEAGNYSIGLHPWYIAENWKDEFAIIQQLSTQKNVKAIGECGLDRLAETDFTLQQEVFAQQIEWANQINKPLIIHCVKAYDEVLQQLKQSKVPAVFHGFNKSEQLANQILKAGHYISFGKVLLQEHLQKVAATLPLQKLFFETDDAALPIQTIYEHAAKVFSIDEDSLSLQLQENAAKVFNYTI
jgi:TatD DNase family protein